MLVGIVLVIIAFNLALPISQLAGTITRSTLGIAMASVLLSFLMMITRRKAVPQVIGFLAMENGLFFAATSATYGMPMVVELGIALDVLVGTFIFGIFFFQIRETFDSLDIHHLEKLKDKMMELLLVLGCPLAGALLLALLRASALGRRAERGHEPADLAGGRRADRPGHLAAGRCVVLHELFFVDAFNVFLVALTAFVGFTTALFSRVYMRVEQERGKLSAGPAAPVSQHVPDVHLHHAAGAAHQQRGHPVGGDGGRHADDRAAGEPVPHAGQHRGGLEVLHPVRRGHRAGAVRHHPAVSGGGEGAGRGRHRAAVDPSATR